MTVINHTPFPAIAFRQLNLMGEMNGVVAVRGTFELVKDGPMIMADSQKPLVMSDTYEGDPHKTSQVAQTDLTPFKPSTDVTLIGRTYAPNLAPTTDWFCRLRVGDAQKTARVTGPRFWNAVSDGRRHTGWRLTPPTPVQQVWLDWSNAWGGPIPGRPDKPQEIHVYNPLGCGIVDLDHCDPRIPVSAPQIEEPDDPIREWNRDYAPCGFGPLSPWWREREQHAGTRDEQWERTRHPLLPEDFNYRYYQSAPPGLVSSAYLKGNEPVEMVNLIPQAPHLKSRLPNVSLRMRLLREGGYGYADLVLDGVHFDMRPDVVKVFLTWRASFPWPDGKGMPELAVVTPSPKGAA